MAELGTGIQERKIWGVDLTVDGRNATISAEVPEQEVHKGYRGGSSDVVYTNPSNLLKNGALPSFSVIRFAKVKNFIDGVYAAAEEEISKGHRLSKRDFLSKLEGKLQKGSEEERYISAVNNLWSNSSSDPMVSKILGFYDWEKSLAPVYRQTKGAQRVAGFFLGSEDDKKLNERVIEAVHKVISEYPELQKKYDEIKRFYSQMTNLPRGDAALFPPAIMPEQQYFLRKALETGTQFEGGLGEGLIKGIKRGEVDFTPEEMSGLYIRQMHEITPLVRRDTPEFEKWLTNEHYQKIMEKEFISQWAGTRHTHVAQSSFHDILATCCAEPMPPIPISPEIFIEPLATSYERMRQSIEFFRGVIEGEIGNRFLSKGRILQNGERSSKSIEEEFYDMDILLRGFRDISMDSLHMQYQTDKKSEEAREKAMDWIKNAASDPDLNRNTAIFVPIIRQEDGTMISYVDAGFKTIEVTARYKNFPLINIENKRMHEFKDKKLSFPVLVHREVRHSPEKLINDRELREKLPEQFTEGELDEVIEKFE